MKIELRVRVACVGREKILFLLKEFLFVLIKMTFLFALDGNDVLIRAYADFICAYSFVSVRKD